MKVGKGTKKGLGLLGLMKHACMTASMLDEGKEDKTTLTMTLTLQCRSNDGIERHFW